MKELWIWIFGGWKTEEIGWWRSETIEMHVTICCIVILWGWENTSVLVTRPLVVFLLLYYFTLHCGTPGMKIPQYLTVECQMDNLLGRKLVSPWCTLLCLHMIRKKSIGLAGSCYYDPCACCGAIKLNAHSILEQAWWKWLDAVIPFLLRRFTLYCNFSKLAEFLFIPCAILLFNVLSCQYDMMLCSYFEV